MSYEPLKLRSSVKSSLKRYTLIRGTLIAGLGALLIVVTGIYLPVQEMQIWGLPILIMGLGLIAFGLMPYRRLSRLENSPNEVILFDDSFQFFSKGRKIYTVPFSSIDKTSLIDNGTDYGIAIWLKKSPEQKVIVHDKKLAYARKGCDIFLPYFTERSFAIFKERTKITAMKLK